MQPSKEKSALYKKLIKGCLRNDRISQRKLYDLFAPGMFVVCLRYARDRHSAEDMLQEGFIKVYRSLQNFRGEGSFEGWVRRIFVNTAIEIYRKESKLFPLVNYEDSSAAFEQTVESDHLELQDLIAYVQRLSTGYRTVFNLYVIEGYSHKEIADLLGISEGTSKSQLARARNLLQKMVLLERKTDGNEAVAK